MLLCWYFARIWSMHSISAQSAVSMASVRQASGCSFTYLACSISIDHDDGAGVLATSISFVLPSVSMKSGSGNLEANVDFPIPSGP